jgi:hypothetical protein
MHVRNPLLTILENLARFTDEVRERERESKRGREGGRETDSGLVERGREGG